MGERFFYLYGYINSLSGTREDVDIYITEDGRVIPIEESTKSIVMSLNNRFTHIKDTDLSNTAIVDYLRNGSSMPQQDFIDKYIWQFSKEANNVGKQGFLALDHEQRIFIGEINNLPTGVDEVDAKTCIQEFYGVYYLPSTAFAVPAGTLQRDVPSSVLDEGFIIVNFDIRTIDEFDGSYISADDYYLSYAGAQSNMWGIESYDLDQGNLIEGDAILYYTDKEASDYYDTSGTH